MPFVVNEGLRIHFHVEGTGAPLVEHHGGTDSMETWYELGYVQALTKAGYQVILVDARGHGHSAKPHDPKAYVGAAMALDVVAVLDHLGIDAVHFWGYSMGGGVGYRMAKYAPERLRSLILGGCPPPTNRTPDPKLIERIRQDPGAIPWYWGGPLPPALQARALRADREVLAARLLAAPLGPSYEDVPESIHVPCLYYSGDADPNFKQIKAAAARTAGATFVPFPGLNHAETLFAKDSVIPHVLRFLASASPKQARV